MKRILLVLVAGCTSQSPLVESSPQIELVTNPGAVSGRPPLELTLTTWNHLAALGDAVDADEITATLDGSALAIAPTDSGYFGNGDRYVAAFVMPDAHAQVATGPASTLTITDPETTWTVQLQDLMTNDLHPSAPMTAGQENTVIWPSAAAGDQPWSTIEWACIQVADHDAACTGDPGVSITQELVTIDVPAQPGDAFKVWGARYVRATASGDGPDVHTTVLGQVTGTFQ